MTVNPFTKSREESAVMQFADIYGYRALKQQFVHLTKSGQMPHAVLLEIQEGYPGKLHDCVPGFSYSLSFSSVSSSLCNKPSLSSSNDFTL